MGEFAGFVNYSADFLQYASETTARLWELAGIIGGCCRNGIDVLEDVGGFIQNSLIPLKPKDYSFKLDNQIYYLFQTGALRPDRLLSLFADKKLVNGIDISSSGAFYMVLEKSLQLFRGPKGPGVYYTLDDELMFSTSLKAFNMGVKPKLLQPGFLALYDINGLSLKGM